MSVSHVSIITPAQTINHEDIVDVTIPTSLGTKRIDMHNGSVQLLKAGKITLFVKRKGSNAPEQVSFYVQDGVAFIEHSVLNVVTSNVQE